MTTATQMSIREKINGDKRYGVAVAIVMILAGAAVAVYELHGFSRVPAVVETTYYSDDGGQTYFKDSLYKFPPFDHDGKTADQVMLYSGKSGPFAGVLLRYTPAAKKQLEDEYQKVQQGTEPESSLRQLMGQQQIYMGGMQAKLTTPGSKWVPRYQLANPRVKAPDGGDAMLIMP